MSGLFLDEFVSIGADTGRGNLVGVQPYLTGADYASAESLHRKLDGYMQAAQRRGWFTPRTVVVWPEFTGTWLVAAGAGQAASRAASIKSLMLRLVMRRPLRFARFYLAAREDDRMASAVFRAQAGQMAAAYQRVFSRLACNFAVTVVAGSIVLPQPSVSGGEVRAGSGALYNSAAVFAPDGSAHASLARKAFPTPDETGFVQAAPLSSLPAFDTPAGRLGVLICADAWFPHCYEHMDKLGVEFLAVPSFSLLPDWHQPWGGYTVKPAPADVDPDDAGRLSEAQAWQRYALGGRLPQSRARAGMNVFMHGQLWDLGNLVGSAALVHRGEVWNGSSIRGGIYNLYLS